MIDRLKIHIVDSQSARRAQLARLAFTAGCHAEIYADRAELLAHAPSDGVILAFDSGEGDPVRPVIEGLADKGGWLPLVMFADNIETDRVVAAIKAGALDYLSLPLDVGPLRASLERVEAEADSMRVQRERAAEARERISRLSAREREVLDRLAAGLSNKAIARELDISPRTVEIHRMKMMGKLGARHAADVVRLRIEAVGMNDIAA